LKTPVSLISGATLDQTPLKVEEGDVGTRVNVHVVRQKVAPAYRCLDERYRVRGLVPICMDLKDPMTIQNAFNKRLLRVVPKPIQAELAELKQYVITYLEKFVPVKYMSFEEWLDGEKSYNEERKEQLRVAYQRNHQRRPELRRCTHIETHGKKESYGEYKNARIINSRPDCFKVWFGPICKTIEEVMYREDFFVKLLNPAQRAGKILDLCQLFLPCYSTDFTAFESHFTPEIMDALEFQLYKRFMLDDDYAFLIAVLGGRNKMKMRCGFKAECDGRRMSGEMSTSLANGFSNMMLAKFIAHKQHKELFGLVEGDDGLFFTEAKLDLKEYENLGFTIKIKNEPKPNLAAFCGIICTEDGVCVKEPLRVLQKLAWSFDYIRAGSKVCKSLMLGKAISLCYEVPQCPVLGVLARKVISDLTGVTARFSQDGYHHIPVQYQPEELNITPSTRRAFADAFNMSEALQIKVEEEILAGNVNNLLKFFAMSRKLQLDPDLDVNGSVVNIKDNLDFEARHMWQENV